MTTIIQIGVCDAKDHVFDYIKALNHDNLFAIFIDANPYSIPLIFNSYNFLHNKIISNVAISTYDGFIKLFLPPWYKTGDAQVASVNKNHVIMHQVPENFVQEIEVPCFSLNTYLNNKLKFSKNDIIDKLFIDVEGHDVDIILSTDFSRLNIKQIYFETAHTDGVHSGWNNIYTSRFNQAAEYLKTFGYVLEEIHTDISSASFVKQTTE